MILTVIVSIVTQLLAFILPKMLRYFHNQIFKKRRNIHKTRTNYYKSVAVTVSLVFLHFLIY